MKINDAPRWHLINTQSQSHNFTECPSKVPRGCVASVQGHEVHLVCKSPFFFSFAKKDPDPIVNDTNNLGRAQADRLVERPPEWTRVIAFPRGVTRSPSRPHVSIQEAGVVTAAAT